MLPCVEENATADWRPLPVAVSIPGKTEQIGLANLAALEGDLDGRMRALRRSPAERCAGGQRRDGGQSENPHGAGGMTGGIAAGDDRPRQPRRLQDPVERSA